jgi:hypothetical protein
MGGWTDSWLIQTSFHEFHVFLRCSLEIGESAEVMRPRDAALQVDGWLEQAGHRETLMRIYWALLGPGMEQDLARPAVDLARVADRLRRGFVDLELVLVRVPRPLYGPGPRPIKPPPIKPPPGKVGEKTWIKIRVIHEDGTPVQGRTYVLTLPAGGARTGTLQARWDPQQGREDNTIEARGIDPGVASIAFPWAARPAPPPQKPTSPELQDEQLTVAWDQTTVKRGETRRMTLQAPALPDGTEVTLALFTETAAGGQRQRRQMAELKLTLQGGRAGHDWDDWFDPRWVTYSVDLRQASGPGEGFPPVSFVFDARHAGGSRRCQAPLVYADALSVQLNQTLRQTRQPLRRCDYLLQSPWGRYAGTTDDEGYVQLQGLPPGGAMIFVNGVAMTRIGEQR